MNPVAGLGRIREALSAAGRDASGFQVSSYLQLAKDDGAIDADATMAPVPAMVEAGITDFRITLNLANEFAACQDMLSPLVQAFRKAVGR
jgi:hypothetical protein